VKREDAAVAVLAMANVSGPGVDASRHLAVGAFVNSVWGKFLTSDFMFDKPFESFERFEQKSVILAAVVVMLIFESRDGGMLE